MIIKKNRTALAADIFLAFSATAAPLHAQSTDAMTTDMEMTADEAEMAADFPAG